MDLHNIEYWVENAIARVKFNAPDRYNIYTFELEDELEQVWSDLSRREDVRGVIFSGQESAFLTGTDLRTLNVNDPVWMVRQAKRSQDLFNQIAEFKSPTLAAVDGFATGAGLELALVCDFRFAAKTASFAAPEVRIGMIPSIGGTQRLTRLIGPEQAKLMIFSGEKISAKEARQIGLVSRVTEPENLLDEAIRVMEGIAANAPVAVANSKMCIDAASDISLDQGLALERNAWLSLCMTDDVVEGVDAFLNKRKPQFKGR